METLIFYALSFIGTPYKWGGNNALTGVDCSGLCCEILRAGGVIGKEDLSAQAIHDRLHVLGGGLKAEVFPGSLLFFGKSDKEITHVAFAVDKFFMVEAGGGGHLTLTKEDAAATGALVRLRPISSRLDLVAKIRPLYPFL